MPAGLTVFKQLLNAMHTFTFDASEKRTVVEEREWATLDQEAQKARDFFFSGDGKPPSPVARASTITTYHFGGERTMPVEKLDIEEEETQDSCQAHLPPSPAIALRLVRLPRAARVASTPAQSNTPNPFAVELSELALPPGDHSVNIRRLWMIFEDDVPNLMPARFSL